MARLVLDLPDDLVAALRAEAEKRHSTPEELLARYVAANPPKTSENPRQSAASFWGAGAERPGAHGSVEAIDAYIRELRGEWE